MPIARRDFQSVSRGLPPKRADLIGFFHRAWTIVVILFPRFLFLSRAELCRVWRALAARKICCSRVSRDVTRILCEVEKKSFERCARYVRVVFSSARPRFYRPPLPTSPDRVQDTGGGGRVGYNVSDVLARGTRSCGDAAAALRKTILKNQNPKPRVRRFCKIEMC